MRGEKRLAYSKQFRGYNIDEVNEDIESLTTELEEKEHEIDDLHKQIEALKEENNKLISQNTITEKTNEEIARLALKEASDLITKAKKNANMILKESMEYVRGLDKEVNGFKDDAIDFRAEVVNLSKELIDTIDKSEIFSLIKEDENTKTETGLE